MFGYRVPDPDEVMLIRGGKATEGEPFRIERKGKWVLPGFRKVAFLGLTQKQAVIEEHCTTTQGLECNVKAVIAFKIAGDDRSIYAAGERFLDSQRADQMMNQQTGQIFSGHLRSIVGAMTLEDIIRQRDALAKQVLEASKIEMGAMGLQVDSFQITHIDDRGSGYIQAMAAPHNAAIQREAAIAQAEANAKAAEAEQASKRLQAEYMRETSVKQAQLQAEMDTEAQRAAQAGPLEAAKASKAVLEQQTELAAQQAQLKAAQLRTEQIKVAEARAEQMRIDAAAQAEQTKILAQARAEQTKLQADAEAHATKVTAEATAAEGKVTLDRMLIEQLPELVTAASKTLQGANVTLFNGAEGANQMVTAALTQGMNIFQTLRGQLERAADADELNRIRQASDM